MRPSPLCLILLASWALPLACGATPRRADGDDPAPTASAGLRAAGEPFEDPETGLWGYRDAQGQVALPARYPLATPYNEQGVAAAVLPEGGRWIDALGRPLIRPYVVDNFPDEWREGLARFVDATGQIGFVDVSAQVAIPARYVFVDGFAEGRAVFCRGCVPVKRGEITFYEGGQWGYLDHSGAEIIPARYEVAYAFEGQRARVKQEGTWRWIDPQGREASAPPEEGAPDDASQDQSDCDCDKIVPPPEAFQKP